MRFERIDGGGGHPRHEDLQQAQIVLRFEEFDLLVTDGRADESKIVLMVEREQAFEVVGRAPPIVPQFDADGGNHADVGHGSIDQRQLSTQLGKLLLAHGQAQPALNLPCIGHHSRAVLHPDESIEHGEREVAVGRIGKFPQHPHGPIRRLGPRSVGRGQQRIEGAGSGPDQSLRCLLPLAVTIAVELPDECGNFHIAERLRSGFRRACWRNLLVRRGRTEFSGQEQRGEGDRD